MFHVTFSNLSKQKEKKAIKYKNCLINSFAATHFPSREINGDVRAAMQRSDTINSSKKNKV